MVWVKCPITAIWLPVSRRGGHQAKGLPALAAVAVSKPLTGKDKRRLRRTPVSPMASRPMARGDGSGTTSRFTCPRVLVSISKRNPVSKAGMAPRFCKPSVIEKPPLVPHNGGQEAARDGLGDVERAIQRQSSACNGHVVDPAVHSLVVSGQIGGQQGRPVHSRVGAEAESSGRSAQGEGDRGVWFADGYWLAVRAIQPGCGL